MVVSGPNARAVTPVMQGAKAAVFGAVDYVSYGNIQQGESLKVIFPASGTVIAPRPMMILKTSQHADDAKAFIDYVLSPEGQARVADAWLMPARRDVVQTSATGRAEGAAHHQRRQQRAGAVLAASVSCTRSN
jgi:iron(III) transport system substrate-binding protein